MGLTYKIDAEAGVVYCFTEGEIGAADIQDRRIKIIADPLYRPEFVLLNDLRSAQLNYTGEEARALGNWITDNRPYSKIAIVVDLKNRGFVRMYQGWSGDDPSIKAFDDMASAREWLGRRW